MAEDWGGGGGELSYLAAYSAGTNDGRTFAARDRWHLQRQINALVQENHQLRAAYASVVAQNDELRSLSKQLADNVYAWKAEWQKSKAKADELEAQVRKLRIERISLILCERD